jgi:hypothetical protein
VASGLFVAAVTVLLSHGPLERRNRAVIAAGDAGAPLIPVGATVGTCAAAAQDWGFVAYAQRFLRLSLRADDRPATGWFLRKDEACAVPPACTHVGGEPPLEAYRCAAIPSASTLGASAGGRRERVRWPAISSRRAAIGPRSASDEPV